MNKEITLEQLASYETAFDSDRANRIAMDAATKNGVNNAAMRFENAREMRHTFNISLEQGDITNQKQSGRCWMFAALNTMRFRIIKKLGIKTFELSQNYALFFDKLEKSNYFLESILETLDEPTAGLDPAGCRGVLENIAAYRRETGSAVLLVTHSMDDAARIADRLIVFHDGHVAFDGTPAEVFAHTQALLDIGPVSYTHLTLPTN